MVSALAPPGFRSAAPRAAQARPAHPTTSSAPASAIDIRLGALADIATSAPAPAIDSRLGALVDIVTRAAAPRADAASNPDALVESFGAQLADAVAELGLVGAE